MAKFEVSIQVNYSGQIEASSAEEAEQLAWSAYYGDDATLEYESVEKIEVEEAEEDEDEEEEE
jgi:hypothetical protein